MPSNEAKAYFTEIDDAPKPSAEQTSIERSVVVNRMQAKLLESNPIFWEVMLYISTLHGLRVPGIGRSC